MEQIHYQNLANRDGEPVFDSYMVSTLEGREILVHYNGFLLSAENLLTFKAKMQSALNAIDNTLKFYDENWDFSEQWNKIREEEWRAEDKKKWDSTKEIKTRVPGKVYLMRDNANNLFKIGYSKDPIYRERTLQSEKPTIELMGAVDAPISYEKQLHETYKDYRVRGEWFSIPEDQQEELKRLFC